MWSRAARHWREKGEWDWAFSDQRCSPSQTAVPNRPVSTASERKTRVAKPDGGKWERGNNEYCTFGHILISFMTPCLFEIAERCAGEHNRFHKYFKADRWAIFSSYFILSHQKPLIFQYLIFKLSEHLQEKDVKCITLTLHSNSTLFAMFTISSICFILPTSWLHASTIYRPKAYTGKLDVSSENLSNLSEVNLVKIVQKKAHYHFIQTLCTWIENVKVWKPGVTLETSFRALSAEAWPCDSGSVFFRMAWNAKKHRVVLDKSSETALQESRQLWLYNWPPGGPVTYWAKFVNCVTGPMQESLG